MRVLLLCFAALKQKYGNGDIEDPVKPSALDGNAKAGAGTAEYLANVENTRALKVCLKSISSGSPRSQLRQIVFD